MCMDRAARVDGPSPKCDFYRWSLPASADLARCSSAKYILGYDTGRRRRRTQAADSKCMDSVDMSTFVGLEVSGAWDNTWLYAETSNVDVPINTKTRYYLGVTAQEDLPCIMTVDPLTGQGVLPEMTFLTFGADRYIQGFDTNFGRIKPNERADTWLGATPTKFYGT